MQTQSIIEHPITHILPVRERVATAHTSRVIEHVPLAARYRAPRSKNIAGYERVHPVQRRVVLIDSERIQRIRRPSLTSHLGAPKFDVVPTSCDN